MKKGIFELIAVVGLVATSGCTTVGHNPDFSPKKNFDGKLVNGEVIMQCSYPESCRTFLIDVKNKTKSDVDLDWNKSFYIKNGQTDGGLYFDGIIVAQRNAPRAPDIIFSEMSMRKTVLPNNNLNLSLFPLAHWEVKDLDGKTNGIMLTFKSGSVEERIKIDFE